MNDPELKECLQVLGEALQVSSKRLDLLDAIAAERFGGLAAASDKEQSAAEIDQTRTAQRTISNTGSMIGLRKKKLIIGVLFSVAAVLVLMGFWSMVERQPKNATISFLCAITCMMTARHTATACIQSVAMVDSSIKPVGLTEQAQRQMPRQKSLTTRKTNDDQ